MGKINNDENSRMKRPGKWIVIFILGGIIMLSILIGSFWFLKDRIGYLFGDAKSEQVVQLEGSQEEPVPTTGDSSFETTQGEPSGEATDGILPDSDTETRNEQEDHKSNERKEIILQADRLALGYDYEGALMLIKNYLDQAGAVDQYVDLTEAYDRLELEKESLVLYGGEYTSITQINHIFFHSLVADNSKAFDDDRRSKGYNMYMTTISEFSKILDKMYRDGYVLVKMADLVKLETLEDGTTRYVENQIYLRPGKKPFVLSQDDVNYYSYMDGDGFATRIVLDKEGKPTCEMLLEDGRVVTGAFDIIPILDAFIEEHPDFSYQGARGLLAITGYEGVLGYRTNNTTSPTYEEDKTAVRQVAQILKEEGWEFASHSWGHKNMTEVSVDTLKRDTDRWLEEVAPLIGETDVYVFPFGADIEKTVGNYSNEKYKYLKKQGFNFFVGVYKEPWMQIKKDYVRMNRRPLDGQAMLQFPERLRDLFEAQDVLDPQRPARNW